MSSSGWLVSSDMAHGFSLFYGKPPVCAVRELLRFSNGQDGHHGRRLTCSGKGRRMSEGHGALVGDHGVPLAGERTQHRCQRPQHARRGVLVCAAPHLRPAQRWSA